jgi:hypothetical protein
MLALLYAGVRFIEAYGLWRMKAWAAWLAIVSGAMYLPVEVFELLKHATFLKGSVLLINAGIVGYLVYVRWLSRRANGRYCCNDRSLHICLAITGVLPLPGTIFALFQLGWRKKRGREHAYASSERAC